MVRSSSSKQWLKEHFDDAWVKRSRLEGYRSRASYKLKEIHNRDGLLRPGMTVVDLGAAPGGWSQVAAELVGSMGRIIACDLLPMDPLPGVQFVQGDFTEQAVLMQLLSVVGDAGADLVISDMAPNLSGIKAIDQPQALYLAELALDLAKTVLKPQAYFLVKLFHGAGLENYRHQLRSCFSKVKIRKPGASRSRSAEIYLLASGWKGN
ncbi:MAG: 23S rRNA (uridine(2552)-2'-O)-methyltransferase RlmE [Gammaproteobacteria bacterium]|nr:23S rRNA (uridine(2552)-2'-O)-methyltransferase RlmE [Gammaproteobacteria bacterium]